MITGEDELSAQKKRPKITDTDNEEDDDDKVVGEGEGGAQVDSQKIVDSSDDENIPIDNDRG